MKVALMRWYYILVCDLLPQRGISLLSAFMTIEAIVIVTGMASKYEEWGARVRMGASAGSALRPFTVIQWKPPANHMIRMMIFRIMSTSLGIRRIREHSIFMYV